MNKLLAIAALLAAPLTASAANYATCLLDKLPGVQNTPAAYAAAKVCRAEYPAGLEGVPQGSGAGLFSYRSGSECALEKAGETQSNQAARMISGACNRLYNPAGITPGTASNLKPYDGPYTPVKP
jgi:hypothetical protein